MAEESSMLSTLLFQEMQPLLLEQVEEQYLKTFKATMVLIVLLKE